jgi:hypothetical protein
MLHLALLGGTNPAKYEVWRKSSCMLVSYSLRSCGIKILQLITL